MHGLIRRDLRTVRGLTADLDNGLSGDEAVTALQSLEVSGPHRDHTIAFARRRGRNAAIVVAGRWFAPFTQGGRTWPKPEAFDAIIDVQGLVVDGYADAGTSIPVSSLFRHLPAAVLKANVVNAARTVRKKAIA